ncbi:MAG: lanthionine synthetase LanC family protein, partial [Candidatus Kariarchaeaceae archaeon]
MHFRHFILFIILLSSTHSIPITLIPTNAYQNQIETSQNPFNSTQFIIEIINTLESEAVYQDEKLLGWPHRADGPFENSERKYRGYYVGMAGIGDFLLSAYNQGYIMAKPLLDEIIQHFIENALDSLTGGKYWGRFSDEETAGWTGLRYGNAGIIKFLSRLVNLNYATGLTELIENGYTYLKSLQLEDQSWPMTEDGYITTDTQYGAVGIGVSFLELYENTGDSTYLDEARDIGNYLINNGIWQDDRFLIPWTPQAIGSEFDGLIVYGKSAGLAGSMDFLIDLFIQSGNRNFLEISIGLGNSIIAADLGGYWPDGSVSYVSRIYSSNIALTGYDVGSSGIADSLTSLYDYDAKLTLLETSARAEKFVLSLLNDDY